MGSEASQSISLKILVEKEKNRVVFAEANKDFVDVIFGFLTMPVGIIVGLTREHLLKGEIGSLNNLYESVEKLDEEHLVSEHKELLLHPRSATEVYFRKLKLNLTENYNGKYYLCSKNDCSFLSYNQIDGCRCGKPIALEIKLSGGIPQDEGVFVKPTARFMVTDDLRVLPMSTMTGLSLLKDCGATDRSKIEERSLNIGKDEILKLLKYSLASMTPLSDTMMEPFVGKTSNTHCIKYGLSTRQFPKVKDMIVNPQITFKLIINRSNNKALYAEVGEDFVSVLCSFLAFPIGYVFKEFPSLPFEGRMGNLYRSIQNLDLDKLFKSEEMKLTLLDPKLAPGLACDCKLFGIEEAVNPSFFTLSSMFTIEFFKLNLESPIGEFKIGQGLVKGPSMFMVTDSLSITPLSPISGLSLINSLKVPLSNVQELKATMGEEEALRLLVASLLSKSALTDTFMLKEQSKNHEEEP